MGVDELNNQSSNLIPCKIYRSTSWFSCNRLGGSQVKCICYNLGAYNKYNPTWGEVLWGEVTGQ